MSQGDANHDVPPTVGDGPPGPCIEGHIQVPVWVCDENGVYQPDYYVPEEAPGGGDSAVEGKGKSPCGCAGLERLVGKAFLAGLKAGGLRLVPAPKPAAEKT